MPQSQPRTIYGVHSLTAYDRTTFVPFGNARVIQGSTFSMTGETNKLYGGSNRFPWQVEDADLEATLSFSVSEYPNWIMQLFGGATVTENGAEASGFVSALANKKGTSIVSATGLLSTITASTPSDLKRGIYIVRATAVDVLKVYALGDADFGRGTKKDFVDDALSIGEWLDIDAGETSAASITGFGFTLTAAAGATNFTVGDTAVFQVRPINTYNRKIVGGGLSDVFPEFGAICYAQKSGSGAVFELDIFKLKAIGLTLGAERKTFANQEYNAEASYDSVRGGVFEAVEVV